jgi:hypothetical protein
MFIVKFLLFRVPTALPQNKQSFLVAGDPPYAEAEGESIAIISDSASSSSSHSSSDAAADEHAVRSGDLVTIAYKGRLTAEHGDRPFDAARNFAFQARHAHRGTA